MPKLHHERRALSWEKSIVLNIHEQRFRKMVQLTGVYKIIEKAEKIRKTMPEVS
jgi:hypothetical protein